MRRVSTSFLRLSVCAFVGALSLGLASRAEARKVDLATTPYVRLEDFQDTFGGALIGPTNDRSIVGFLSALQRFNGKAVLGLELANQTRIPEFDAFIQEAQASLDSVPIPSGSASVAYNYDEKLQTFVRWVRPFTPALSQNAYTSGKGVLTLGASYSRLDFTNYDGFDNNNNIFVVGKGLLPGGQINGISGFDIFDVMYFNFRLRENVFGFSMQYGLLDNLDVGIFIPVVDLHFQGRGIDTFVGKTPLGFLLVTGNRTFVTQLHDLRESDFTTFEGQIRNGIRFNEDKTGIADIVLRSKLYLASVAGLDFGALLNLSLPTGDDDNLLGTGSVRVDPRLLVSSGNERFSVHANFGPHFDTDVSDLNRFDYATGIEVQLVSWASLAVDHVGRLQYSGNEFHKYELVPGFKVKIAEGLVAGFNAIIPLNDQGLTTDVTPNVAGDFSYVF